VILEALVFKFALILFKLDYDTVYTVPFIRFIAILSIYFIEFIIYYIIKKFKANITLIESIDTKSKISILISFILAAISIGIQLYLTTFYSDSLPLFVTLISLFTLIAYFIVTLYNLSRTTKLEMTQRDLEQSKLYNKTLTILHDNIRCFKHDFHNIIQAIGGYIQTNDIEGLRKYYNQISADCQKSNNLAVLNPDVINNPAVYSILASKYHQADAKGITINLEIFLDLSTLRIKIYEFTRILGILLDNAIEASSECEEKLINITIRDESNRNRQLLVIQNTYNNKDVDTEKIYEKGFSTKSQNTGLGLWEVRKILSKNNNLNLFTSKNDKFFSQQLEIY